MCGIAGAVGAGVEQAGRLGLEAALSAIRHRGPDSSGQFREEQVLLGHVRLSILDLSSAAGQPMVSADGRFVIVYNGEVYNFSDLACALGLDGLRTHSDTEVVLRAFAQRGIASVSLFNGMFAFAVYDRQEQKIWLVRDRLGIKPLYYRADAQGFCFASEIEALNQLGGGEHRCDLRALHEWLYFGNTLGEPTLFQDVKRLLPGHYLELDVATLAYRIGCYWSPLQCLESVAEGAAPVERQIVRTRELLEQAIKRQLVSDVPVGIFLSGGIDSSAITAFASRHYGGRLATYSAGFDFDKGVNELPKAREIARRYGTEHHELHISGFAIADVVEKMVHHHGMPFSDAANIPLFLLGAEVASSTKVVLQGDGGDEMFGGYSRYTTLSHYKLARLMAKMGGALNSCLPRNAGYFRRRRYFNALVSGDVAEMMALLLTEEDRTAMPAMVFTPEFRQQVEAGDPFARYRQCQGYFRDLDVHSQMFLVDAMIILPDIFLEKVDRSTMAASVEVRVPFLDNDLVDFCLRLPGSSKVPDGKKKWLLKQALRGIVPDEVLFGKKTGFGVPYGYWLRGALRPLFFDQLNAFQSACPRVLDVPAIHALYDEHVSRRRDRSFLLWKILNLMIWANRNRVAFV